ncbi:hypothetical protein Pan44_48590 [Caulifigura coniformis]|uniref:DUF1552 domain-containing protein n=1 Tax=Caulifigura coniformis TaxID=2527983 RepID=A0A517SKZ1_9PLAN|nr:DUF1552 domain-containing protein [Caulifigura coniformis]QDT56799.1 hypothetical protein Pan44_48590 [Caulifigura coniformis]
MHLPRRTFLKGMGASLGLPFLDAMLPRTVLAGAAAKGAVAAAPTRMAFVFFPNGAIMRDWKPTKAGTDFELPKTLTSLEKHRSDMLVVSGLAHDKGRANGDGAGDHARSCAVFLTGCQPKKTGGADIQAGMSVDQIAAEKYGRETKLPSLELGIESGRQAGSCDSGYSCAYSSNISWKSPSQPMAKEINPKLAFERLFGDSRDAQARAERDYYRKSILDFVATDSAKLNSKLGTTDRRKLDEYFTSIREIEMRIDRASEDRGRLPDQPAPDGIPGTLTEHIRLMYDLMVMGFQTDATRISTFMLASEGSNRTYPEVEVTDAHHQLSHHRNEEEKMVKIQRIDQYLVDQFAYFIDRMKATKEGDKSLLDRSMIVYGSGISDGNRHSHHDLPVLMLGKGNGAVATGRHMQLEGEVPMTNLFLAMLDKVGASTERMGDSTGKLTGLS